MKREKDCMLHGGNEMKTIIKATQRGTNRKAARAMRAMQFTSVLTVSSSFRNRN